METSNAGSTVSAQMMNTSAKLLASDEKLQPLSASMKLEMYRALYVPQTSSIASSRKAPFGLSSEMERWSMNVPFEYMQTPVGLAKQFQRVLATLEASCGNPDTVEYVLSSFCQRMSDGHTLALLSKVVEFPVDSELTMIRFLEFLRSRRHTVTNSTEAVIANLERQLKAMEISSPILKTCGRIFTWTDRGSKLGTRDHVPNKGLYEDNIQQYTGKVNRREVSEPKSAIDDAVLNLYRLKYKATGVSVYFWTIKLSDDGLVIAKGFAETFEEAAGFLYKAFYRALTKKRAVDAMKMASGTQLVVMGNWITNEEYNAYPNKENLQIVHDACDDTRDDKAFVIGWPVLGRQKALVTIYKVQKARSYGELSPDNCVITLRSGFTLDASSDFYVYRAERNLQGEVMCCKCGQIASRFDFFDAVIVRGTGLMCGVCRDHFFDMGEISDDAFDTQDIIMPVDIQTDVSMSEE